jgi:hypothetical protein
MNEELFQGINRRKKIHLTRTVVGAANSRVIRFVVCSSWTESKDVKLAVEEVVNVVNEITALKLR